MSAAPLTVRGLACPFDQCAYLAGGVTELVARDAFILEPARTEIHVGRHGGPSLKLSGLGGLRLWQNSSGLCFEVELRDDSCAVVAAFVRGGRGCSVQFDPQRCEYSETKVGARRERVIHSAAIDHIALVSGPAYRGTAAWMSIDEARGCLSWPLHQLARRVAEGRDAAASASAPTSVSWSSSAAAVPETAPAPVVDAIAMERLAIQLRGGSAVPAGPGAAPSASEALRMRADLRALGVPQWALASMGWDEAVALRNSRAGDPALSGYPMAGQRREVVISQALGSS